MRAVVAVATAGLMAVSGATVATTAGSGAALAADAAPGAVSIAFGACQDEALIGAGAECGFLSVPLDWSKPKGEKIKVAVSRVKATEKRQGVMLVNPGGPGGSGLVFPAILPQAVPNNVGLQYDWIGFDPRGVGASQPAVSCIPDYAAGPRPAYIPESRTSRSPNELEWLARTKRFAKACADNNGPIIEHMRTIDTIKDMDALRVALGEKQINFFGFSYGTFLGQTYATRYPDKIRRLVLSGSVEPTYGGYGDGGKAQTEAFQVVLDEFFTWIANRNATYAAGATQAEVKATYNDMITELTKAPVGTVGSSELADVFITGAYSENLWVPIAAAFADAVAGDFAFLERVNTILNDPTNDNAYAAFNTTLCSDGKFPRSYSKVRNDGFELAKTAPTSTWGSFWFSQPCTFWPVPAGSTPEVDGSKVKIPILMVQQTLDGATPYAGALAVRKEFPTAVLLAEVGATTHSSVFDGNACIDDTIAAYLLDGSLPTRVSGEASDKECDRIPFPEPSIVDRGLPQGLLGSFVGAPEPLESLLNGIPVSWRR
ncbi:MAG: alpha/beta hydrolase [Sporichthyaceae bacterium]